MKKLYFILHNIRSAYNVGSMFRTADGIGVAQVYLTGYTCTPSDGTREWTTKPERMVGKTALGADQVVSWEKYEDIVPLIAQLQSEGVQVVALEQSPTSVDYCAFVPRGDATGVALILGNEPVGIDAETLDLADSTIDIPMRGSKKSLNVAVAAGVAGYQLSHIL